MYKACKAANEVHITYDSGADGHYISEKDQQTAQLPILRLSTKKVQVANGETSTAINVTTLPFPQLSNKHEQQIHFDTSQHR